MKKNDFPIGSIEYVFLHGNRKIRKGKKPSCQLNDKRAFPDVIKNPKNAFLIASKLFNDKENTLLGKPQIHFGVVSWGKIYNNFVSKNGIPKEYFPPKGGYSIPKCIECYYRMPIDSPFLPGDCNVGKNEIEGKNYFNWPKRIWLPFVFEYGKKDIASFCPYFLNFPEKSGNHGC